MTRAAIDDLAEAIKDALNAETFSMPFTATRKRKPEFTLEQLDTLRVTVVPASTATEQLTRGKLEDTVKVDVAVQQRLADAEDETEGDALSYLLEQIKDFFVRYTLTSPAAECLEINTVEGAEAGYSPAHLRELSVYTGVIRSTWRMERAVP